MGPTPSPRLWDNAFEFLGLHLVFNVDLLRPYFPPLLDTSKVVEKLTKLPIGSYEELFLQMKPNLFSHLEFVWDSMLIMALLVLGIGFLQNIMNLLSDVLNPFNEPSGFVNLCVSMRGFGLCGCKGKSYINGAQWLKPKVYLKRIVTSRYMKRFVIVVLNIRNALIPCTWMFGVVHM